MDGSPSKERKDLVGRFVRCTPCFYGYFLAAFATMGLIATGPGQTPVIGTTITDVSRDLGLTRTQVSSLYLAATLGSACTLPLVGKWLDQFGPPPLFFVASLGLGLTCWVYSFWCSSATLLAVCFYGLRLFGQGTLTMVSQNAINNWFEKKRGRVMGVCSFVNNVCLTGLFSSLVKEQVIVHGWRSAYLALGFIEVCIVLPLGLIFIRNKPEVYGLLPDGEDPSLKIAHELVSAQPKIEHATSNGHGEGGDIEMQQNGHNETLNNNGHNGNISDGPTVVGRALTIDELDEQEDDVVSPVSTVIGTPADSCGEDFTLKEALRTLAFWNLTIGAFTIAALGTALMFHLDALFPKQKGYEPYLYRVYLSSAVTAAIVTLIAGVAADKIKAKFMMSAALFMNATAMVSSAALCAHSSFMGWPLYVIGCANGVTFGLFGLVVGVTYANWFGRAHLGKIQGLGQSLIVLGSAVGPAIISVGRDLWKSYATVLVFSALLPITCGLAILCANKPKKPQVYSVVVTG